MTGFILVHDLVESNGKTVKENNLELGHDIALGTLVEIDCEHNSEHRTRQFVAGYERDCDGTPLYSVTTHRNLCDDRIDTDEYNEPRTKEDITLKKRFYRSGGWSDCSLTVIPE